MNWSVRLAPKAEKDLAQLRARDKQRVVRALRSLEKNPFAGKKLKGELYGLYSVRVWPFRIIYSIYRRELIVAVIRIGHRQGVYSS